MSQIEPVKQFNEWSCGLACISWILESRGCGLSQQDIIHKIGVYFPEWTFRPGLCNSWDIIEIFNRLGIPTENFILTSSVKEALTFFERVYNEKLYIASFAFTKRPTNHSLVLDTLDDKACQVMIPSQQEPRYADFSWEDLKKTFDPDIMILAQRRSGN